MSDTALACFKALKRYCTTVTTLCFIKFHFEDSLEEFLRRFVISPKLSSNHYENCYKWRVLVSKHYYKIFVKCMVKGVKQGSLHDNIFQSSSKQFQSNISQPNNNINFYSPSHLHFSESKSNYLLDFSIFWKIYLFCGIISKSGKKGPRLYIIYQG